MRKSLFPLVLLMVFILPVVWAQVSVDRVLVVVYENGYAKVIEIVTPSNYSVAVDVPLLSADITGLSVIDEDGKPLLFEKNGSVLTVYLLNSTTRIMITYFTASLTSKSGKIWNLSYSFPYPVTIELPKNAVVVDLSSLPLAITSTAITMPPGNQSVSYILPLPTSTSSSITPTSTANPVSSTQPTTSSTTSASTTSTPQTTPKSASSNASSLAPSSQAEPHELNILPLLGLLAIVGVSTVAYWFRNRRSSGSLPPSKEEFRKKLEELGLTDDEVSALLYVYDQGGKAKQADVRKALGIPKTTAWRMFKRLEEKGLVRVYKRGKENWVELIFT